MQRFATWMAGVAMAVAPAGGGMDRGGTRLFVESTLTVSITSGPSTIQPNKTCEWLAAASGGTAPYTWDWSGGTTIYEDEGYYLARSSSSFYVTVQVTDAAGSTASASRYVGVSSTAPTCIL
ncbi:MAG TPA: hypothetical protein VHG08_23395 [Longimicrobium sp.]|nr:hypothetical protein [Longimicrobium sp.]